MYIDIMLNYGNKALVDLIKASNQKNCNTIINIFLKSEAVLWFKNGYGQRTFSKQPAGVDFMVGNVSLKIL